MPKPVSLEEHHSRIEQEFEAAMAKGDYAHARWCAGHIQSMSAHALGRQFTMMSQLHSDAYDASTQRVIDSIRDRKVILAQVATAILYLTCAYFSFAALKNAGAAADVTRFTRLGDMAGNGAKAGEIVSKLFTTGSDASRQTYEAEREKIRRDRDLKDQHQSQHRNCSVEARTGAQKALDSDFDARSRILA